MATPAIKKFQRTDDVLGDEHRRKLSPEVLQRILFLHLDQGLTVIQLAARFGVAASLICRVLENHAHAQHVRVPSPQHPSKPKKNSILHLRA